MTGHLLVHQSTRRVGDQTQRLWVVTLPDHTNAEEFGTQVEASQFAQRLTHPQAPDTALSQTGVQR